MYFKSNCLCVYMYMYECRATDVAWYDGHYVFPIDTTDQFNARSRHDRKHEGFIELWSLDSFCLLIKWDRCRARIDLRILISREFSSGPCHGGLLISTHECIAGGISVLFRPTLHCKLYALFSYCGRVSFHARTAHIPDVWWTHFRFPCS